ncbi:MAG: hydroxylamine reductase [Victivallaceae bacterium]|nr:hydroxylamine reductase [Victivallaceae bacterium]
MSDNMFCFQCEQTAGGHGCTGQVGVCGKTAEAAALQDLLLRLTEELAQQRIERHCESSVLDDMMTEALFTTITNVNFSTDDLERRCRKVACSFGKKLPGDREELLERAATCGVESVRARHGNELCGRIYLMLFGLKGLAAYTYHAARLGYRDPQLTDHICRALAFVLHPDIRVDEMVKLTLECGSMNLRAMELLDRAHREQFGRPEPTRVRVTPLPGKAILVSGHDLGDLRRVLEATRDTGVNVYTHGEMLTANSYPELKRYPHLVGNYGGAWQEQRREFAEFPGPILLTTNCLMPPVETYRDRVYTSGPVSFPDTRHLDESDFGQLVEAANHMAGFDVCGEERFITVGFGHDAIEVELPQILDLLNSGRLRHIFIIGGCDGARPGRNYYSLLAEQVPDDCIIMTLACGKYRFNKHEFGAIDGLPRLLDLGQCNDAYSAVRVITLLGAALHTDVNHLPVSINLSWYEQKAVAVLLSLLSLGVQNITLGPTLPAFVTPEVLHILTEKYHLKLAGSPTDDLEEAMERRSYIHA